MLEFERDVVEFARQPFNHPLLRLFASSLIYENKEKIEPSNFQFAQWISAFHPATKTWREAQVSSIQDEWILVEFLGVQQSNCYWFRRDSTLIRKGNYLEDFFLDTIQIGAKCDVFINQKWREGIVVEKGVKISVQCEETLHYVSTAQLAEYRTRSGPKRRFGLTPYLPLSSTALRRNVPERVKVASEIFYREGGVSNCLVFLNDPKKFDSDFFVFYAHAIANGLLFHAELHHPDLCRQSVESLSQNMTRNQMPILITCLEVFLKRGLFFSEQESADILESIALRFYFQTLLLEDKEDKKSRITAMNSLEQACDAIFKSSTSSGFQITQSELLQKFVESNIIVDVFFSKQLPVDSFLPTMLLLINHLPLPGVLASKVYIEFHRADLIQKLENAEILNLLFLFEKNPNLKMILEYSNLQTELFVCSKNVQFEYFLICLGCLRNVQLCPRLLARLLANVVGDIKVDYLRIFQSLYDESNSSYFLDYMFALLQFSLKNHLSLAISIAEVVPILSNKVKNSREKNEIIQELQNSSGERLQNLLSLIFILFQDMLTESDLILLLTKCQQSNDDFNSFQEFFVKSVNREVEKENSKETPFKAVWGNFYEQHLLDKNLSCETIFAGVQLHLGNFQEHFRQFLFKVIVENETHMFENIIQFIIREGLVSETIEAIEELVTEMSRAQVKSSLLLFLKSLLYSSDSGGTRGYRSHMSNSLKWEHIVVSYQLPRSHPPSGCDCFDNIIQREFVISTKTCATVWDLKVLIGRESDLGSPNEITLVIEDRKYSKGGENSKLLAEFHAQRLTCLVFKEIFFETCSAPLLRKTVPPEFSTKARHAFTTIFKERCSPKGYLGINRFIDLIEECTRKRLSETTVKNLFQSRGIDCEIGMDLTEFLKFYAVLASKEPQKVRKDLKTFKYDENFNKMSQHARLTFEFDQVQEMLQSMNFDRDTTSSTSFRACVMSSKEIYKFLQDSIEHKDAWDILMQLPSCPTIIEQVKSPGFNLTLFQGKMILYVAQIYRIVFGESDLLRSVGVGMDQQICYLAWNSFLSQELFELSLFETFVNEKCCSTLLNFFETLNSKLTCQYQSKVVFEAFSRLITRNEWVKTFIFQEINETLEENVLKAKSLPIVSLISDALPPHLKEKIVNSALASICSSPFESITCLSRINLKLSQIQVQRLYEYWSELTELEKSRDLFGVLKPYLSVELLKDDLENLFLLGGTRLKTSTEWLSIPVADMEPEKLALALQTVFLTDNITKMSLISSKRSRLNIDGKVPVDQGKFVLQKQSKCEICCNFQRQKDEKCFPLKIQTMDSNLQEVLKKIQSSHFTLTQCPKCTSQGTVREEMCLFDTKEKMISIELVSANKGIQFESLSGKIELFSGSWDISGMVYQRGFSSFSCIRKSLSHASTVWLCFEIDKHVTSFCEMNETELLTLLNRGQVYVKYVSLFRGNHGDYPKFDANWTGNPREYQQILKEEKYFFHLNHRMRSIELACYLRDSSFDENEDLEMTFLFLLSALGDESLFNIAFQKWDAIGNIPSSKLERFFENSHFVERICKIAEENSTNDCFILLLSKIFSSFNLCLEKECFVICDVMINESILLAHQTYFKVGSIRTILSKEDIKAGQVNLVLNLIEASFDCCSDANRECLCDLSSEMANTEEYMVRWIRKGINMNQVFPFLPNQSKLISCILKGLNDNENESVYLLAALEDLQDFEADLLRELPKILNKETVSRALSLLLRGECITELKEHSEWIFNHLIENSLWKHLRKFLHVIDDNTSLILRMVDLYFTTETEWKPILEILQEVKQSKLDFQYEILLLDRIQGIRREDQVKVLFAIGLVLERCDKHSNLILALSKLPIPNEDEDRATDWVVRFLQRLPSERPDLPREYIAFAMQCLERWVHLDTKIDKLSGRSKVKFPRESANILTRVALAKEIEKTTSEDIVVQTLDCKDAILFWGTNGGRITCVIELTFETTEREKFELPSSTFVERKLVPGESGLIYLGKRILAGQDWGTFSFGWNFCYVDDSDVAEEVIPKTVDLPIDASSSPSILSPIAVDDNRLENLQTSFDIDPDFERESENMRMSSTSRPSMIMEFSENQNNDEANFEQLSNQSNQNSLNFDVFDVEKKNQYASNAELNDNNLAKVSGLKDFDPDINEDVGEGSEILNFDLEDPNIVDDEKSVKTVELLNFDLENSYENASFEQENSDLEDAKTAELLNFDIEDENNAWIEQENSYLDKEEGLRTAELLSLNDDENDRVNQDIFDDEGIKNEIHENLLRLDSPDDLKNNIFDIDAKSLDFDEKQDLDFSEDEEDDNRTMELHCDESDEYSKERDFDRSDDDDEKTVSLHSSVLNNSEENMFDGASGIKNDQEEESEDDADTVCLQLDSVNSKENFSETVEESESPNKLNQEKQSPEHFPSDLESLSYRHAFNSKDQNLNNENIRTEFRGSLNDICLLTKITENDEDESLPNNHAFDEM